MNKPPVVFYDTLPSLKSNMMIAFAYLSVVHTQTHHSDEESAATGPWQIYGEELFTA
jgi:hypothetical protein